MRRRAGRTVPHARPLVALIALALGAVPVTSAAQSTRSILLRLDNDTFNFWRTPGERPDEEYTSGVRLSYEGGGAPWWGGFLTGKLTDCAPHVTNCRSRSIELGQSIYTPKFSDDGPPVAGSRTPAGWLYAMETARRLSARRADDFSIVVGVTGEPALAHVTQRVAHAFAPGFNRPVDWSSQLGFEPGVIVRYAQTRRLAAGAFDLLPGIRMDAGNVSTLAEASVHVRGGFNLPHPWLAQRPAMRPAIVVSAGAAARAVGRDMFLDGNTIGDNGRVGHEVFVHSLDWSVAFNYRWLRLSYGAVRDGRTYARGPASHTWSSMVGGVSFVR